MSQVRAGFHSVEGFQQQTETHNLYPAPLQDSASCLKLKCFNITFVCQVETDTIQNKEKCLEVNYNELTGQPANCMEHKAFVGSLCYENGRMSLSERLLNIYQTTHHYFKECHPRCVGELDRWEGSQKHNSYLI